jgi:hypothetical protein
MVVCRTSEPTAEVCYYVAPMRDPVLVNIEALLRVPPPPYMKAWSWADYMHVGVGKPFWLTRTKLTVRVGLTPRFVLIFAPEENGGGAAIKIRF